MSYRSEKPKLEVLKNRGGPSCFVCNWQPAEGEQIKKIVDTWLCGQCEAQFWAQYEKEKSVAMWAEMKAREEA